MKRIVIIASALLLTVVQAFAQQEFKVAKNGGKLVINNISNLKVEGYEGKEIIFFTAGKKEKPEDPRAVGLSALSSSGFDNTGIGISVIDKENVTIVTPIERNLSLKVKIPYSVSLSLKTTGFPQGDSTSITLSNIKSEIDASTQHENILLKNVTGPVSIKTLHGYIEGKLTPSFKGPISLVSVYGFIDVTVPDNAKADMTISTQYETLYAAKDLKLVIDEKPIKELNSSGAITVSGKATGQNLHVVTVDGTTVTTTTVPKAKGTTTTSTETFPATAPTPPIVGQGFRTNEKTTTTGKKAEIITDDSYNYTTLGSLSFLNSSRGTVINGKLNGGGEKIILKSTHGKIYLRK